MTRSNRRIADGLVVLLAGLTLGYSLVWEGDLFFGLLVAAWIGLVYHPLRRGEPERALEFCGLWGLVVVTVLLGNPILILAGILFAVLGYVVWTRERNSRAA